MHILTMAFFSSFLDVRARNLFYTINALKMQYPDILKLWVQDFVLIFLKKKSPLPIFSMNFTIFAEFSSSVGITVSIIITVTTIIIIIIVIIFCETGTLVSRRQCWRKLYSSYSTAAPWVGTFCKLGDNNGVEAGDDDDGKLGDGAGDSSLHR